MHQADNDKGDDDIDRNGDGIDEYDPGFPLHHFVPFHVHRGRT
jgi:hypothetical protein